MEHMPEDSYAGMWFVKKIKDRKECENSKILVISGSYDIQEVAEQLNVDFVPKDTLLKNPSVLNYKLEEILTFGSI
jgi:hypothetical protein